MTRNGITRCDGCGRRPTGLNSFRKTWGLNCPIINIPATGNPEETTQWKPSQLIANASVWINGGGESAHICDDCLRIGLRHIKLEIDRLLEVVEAGADKDEEIQQLTARITRIQCERSDVSHAHNRMQDRLGELLGLADQQGLKEKGSVIKYARWEVSRGHISGHQIP